MMNSMTFLKHKTRWLITGFGIVPFLMITISQGCAGFKGESAGLASLGQCAGNEGAQDINVVQGTRIVSLVYGQAVLDNMLSCTGLGTPSAVTQQEWETRQGVFSDYGFASEVSAPMMLAIAALSARVCQDIIDKEAPDVGANRFIFTDYDLAGNAAAPSGPQIDSVIDRLAVGCWQRNPASQERTAIHSYAGQVAQSAATAGRDAAIAICTAMLSSLSAIEL